MSKKEFLLGMIIISFCITIWTIIDKPPINSTAYVRVTQKYTIETKIDKDGNVEVEVK